MLDDVATKPQTMEEQGYGPPSLKTWNVIKQGKLTLMAHQICMEGKMGWEMIHVREEILGFQVYMI
jgi:hypothetical protein